MLRDVHVGASGSREEGTPNSWGQQGEGGSETGSEGEMMHRHISQGELSSWTGQGRNSCRGSNRHKACGVESGHGKAL